MLEEDQIVNGIVVRHEVYGAFVEIGEPELSALLLDPLVDGDMSEARHSLPQVGDQIRAVFLGMGARGALNRDSASDRVTSCAPRVRKKGESFGGPDDAPPASPY